MGWLIAGLARLALLFVWILTPLVGRAFHGAVWDWLLPLLGLLLFPITTLTYIVVNALAGGVTGWAWAWVVMAVFADLVSHSAPAVASNRRRTTRMGTA